MTPDQIQEYRTILKRARIADDDPSLKYEFRKGWGEAINFAEAHYNRIFGKETEQAK